MEQSPIVGYLKAFTFAVLAFVLFLAVWQGTKTEEKIVRLDQGVADLDRNVRELRNDLRGHQAEIDKLRGVNETLLKVIAQGGVSVRADAGARDDPGTGTGTGLFRSEEEERGWGWALNGKLDSALDPERPVGAPGRYPNFLRLDPDGSDSPENAPNRDGTINLTWGSEPKGFNFLLENYATLSDECQLYVADAPANRHRVRPSSFNWAPALCWRVEVSPDYREYTLFFRKDAFWQPPSFDVRKYPHLEGKFPVTAHDLKFSLDIILDKQSNLAVMRSYLDQLEGVEVVDDYTAVVRWKSTVFVSLANTLGATILPRHVYAHDENGEPYPPETLGQQFNDHWFDRLRVGPIACGPYRFVEYRPNQFVRLERWDDWYGFKDQPLYPVRVRHLRIYQESETAMNWLYAGDVDVQPMNSTRYREWVLEGDSIGKNPFKDGRIHLFKPEIPVYSYIGWKNSDPLFADVRVRKALTYACNRLEISDRIYLGRMTPMGPPIFPRSEEADPSLEPYPFDPARAAALLDEAGWAVDSSTGLRTKVVDGQTLVLDFKIYHPSGIPEYENFLNLYKNDLLDLGIRMEPQAVQWAQFQKDLNDRKYKAFTLAWATGGWEHDFKQIWHSEGIQDPGSSNYIEFNDPEVDRLSDELRTIMDPERRVEVVHRIGKILYERQPYTFLGWRREYRAYWDHVKNAEELYNIRPFWRSFPVWIER